MHNIIIPKRCKKKHKTLLIWANHLPQMPKILPCSRVMVSGLITACWIIFLLCRAVSTASTKATALDFGP